MEVRGPEHLLELPGGTVPSPSDLQVVRSVMSGLPPRARGMVSYPSSSEPRSGSVGVTSPAPSSPSTGAPHPKASQPAGSPGQGGDRADWKCPNCSAVLPKIGADGYVTCSFCHAVFTTGQPTVAPASALSEMMAGELALSIQGLSVLAGSKALVQDINLNVASNKVTAIIGPSGCGKTTLLRALNRMTELSGLKVRGQVLYGGRNIYGAGIDAVRVRRRIGMVFQRPTVFPSSIFENVAFGLRIDHEPEDVVERTVITSLKRAGIWDEVKDELDRPALTLSGGQQQRLCIARALAVSPKVLLMDEPTSSLDPIATQKVEDMIFELKQHYTVVIVTHNMQQAARVADLTAFLFQGKLVEFGLTKQIFESPREKLTENYITGRFG